MFISCLIWSPPRCHDLIPLLLSSLSSFGSLAWFWFVVFETLFGEGFSWGIHGCNLSEYIWGEILENLTLKHHDPDLREDSNFIPLLVDFLINSWSFRGDVLAISLVCPGAPLVKSSSFLVNMCWVYLFKYLFATVSGLFSWSPDHPMLSFLAPSDIPVVFKWPPDLPVVFSIEHRIFLWFFSSNHRIILCTVISSNHLAVFFLLDRIIRWYPFK